MYVIYHSSDSFGKVTAVSIASLLENNKAIDQIHIFYIEKNMLDVTKRKIENLVNKYGRTIEFIKMPNWSEKLDITLKSCKNGWLGFGYNRLFLTELIPENIDKVLYLDSDTVIERSLEELWDIDMENYYLAGVDDCLSYAYRELVEIPDNTTYCNAGVLLINLKKWREDQVLDGLIKYVTDRNGYFIFNEQSVLNSFFAKEILVLPCKYNVTSLVYTFSYEELMLLRAPYRYSYGENEYNAAKSEPVITHFTGCFYINRRPWLTKSDHPHAKTYDEYYMLTPWAGNEYDKPRCNWKSRIVYMACHLMPRKLMLKLANFAYTNLRVSYFHRKLVQMRE